MTPSCRLNTTGPLRHESGGSYLDPRRKPGIVPTAKVGYEKVDFQQGLQQGAQAELNGLHSSPQFCSAVPRPTLPLESTFDKGKPL